jgi:putative ATP-dependent endonuclease of the OLD family
MHIVRLKISGFREVPSGDMAPGRHAVLVNPNNSGKTTIIDVRRLTERDRHGNAPDETSRILCSAAVTGFTPNGPRHHPIWFNPERGGEKSSDPKSQILIEHQRPARSQDTAFPKSIEG